MLFSLFILKFLLINTISPNLTSQNKNADINNLILSEIDTSLIDYIINEHLIDSKNDIILQNSNFLIQNIFNNNNSEIKVNTLNNTDNQNNQSSNNYTELIQLIILLCENPEFKPLTEYIVNSSFFEYLISNINTTDSYFSTEKVFDIIADGLYYKNVSEDLAYIIYYLGQNKKTISILLSNFPGYFEKEIDLKNLLIMLNASSPTFLNILDILTKGDEKKRTNNVDRVKDLIHHLKDTEYLSEELAKFIYDNKELYDELIDLLILIIKIECKYVDYFKNLLLLLSKRIYELNDNNIYKDLNISQGCLKLINYTFMGTYQNEDKYNITMDFVKYYLYKFILQSSTAKNEFFSYNYCLDKSTILKGFDNKDGNTYNSIEINTTLSYVVTFIDKTRNNFNNIIKSTDYEKLYYYLSGCFPQGEKTPYNYDNDSQTYYYCENEDYSKLIKALMKNLTNLTGVELESFQMMYEDKDDKTEKYLSFIPLFILIIPFVLSLIVFLFRGKYLKKKTKYSKIENPLKNGMNNQLLLEEEIKENKTNPDIDEGEDEEEVKKESINNLNIAPKWYRILNEFFNFRRNFDELFAFDFNNKNFNNMAGLNYISGIMGISMILTILGETFLVIMNLPMKQFKYSAFYGFIFNFLYFLPFIGLRYSPRILFSCSGYICVYKYLSFIERGEKNYFFKFFFPQTYKYIYFILIILFLRYSLFYLQKTILNPGISWEIFNRKILKHPDNLKDFIKELLMIKIYNTEEKFENKIGTLFSYLWMPINEFTFFFLSTSLVSIGHKFKLKIDYLIIILIILLYAFKILYYFYKKKYDEEVYTTLYYYLFHYGRFMINPFFNLNYYLIGMYFGFMNYTIQKGIIKPNNENDIKKFNSIVKKNLLEDEDEILKKDKKEEKEEESDKNGHNNSRILSISTLYNIDEDLINEEKEENDGGINEYQSSKSYKIIKKNKRNPSSLGSIFDKKYSNKNPFENINKNKVKLDKIPTSSSLNHSKDSIELSDSGPEIQQMPFLKSAMNIVNIHKNKKIMKCVACILFILFLIILFFIFGHNILFISDKNPKTDSLEDLRKKYQMEYLITSNILNIIYLIDIEIVVFWTQWILFFIYMKGLNTIIDFFSHLYWSNFVKSYFSFLISMNPIILYIFYQSDTLIILNGLFIYIYFFISLVFISFIIIINFIIFELPLKKIFRYLFKRTGKISNKDDFYLMNEEGLDIYDENK